MWILWPRGDFGDVGDPLRSLGAPPGGFRAHILVGGCSFMLSHMFKTRINHKTFCCNLFVVPPALDRTIIEQRARSILLSSSIPIELGAYSKSMGHIHIAWSEEHWSIEHIQRA